MKKLTTLMLMVALTALPLFAGGSQESDGKVRLRMAGQYAPDHSTTQLQYKFAEMVKERSNGEIDIRVFPANQLGDYTQVYEELSRGTIEMATISVPSQFDSRLDVTYLHYLAMNYDEASRVYSRGSAMFDIMDELHAEQDVKFLGFNGEGFGILGFTRMPDNVKDPRSAKNILLRVPPMAVFQMTAADQNFQTVSIPFAELYTALQTGVADGWSGGPAMVNYVQFGDVIRGVLINNNFFENTSYLISKSAWNALSPQHQQILQEVADEISLESLTVARDNDAKYPPLFRERGIEVVTMSDAELQAWAEHARSVTWPRLEERLTKEVIDRLLADY